ncbi:hypothetical protein D8O27_21940 [Burkholderia mallei]|uniref:Uncharacterized protein n=3 Tax=pseudomallei group TaxID=111527 RepID=A0AAX1XDP0_BURML|nr:hypothetical protein BURPS1106A_A2322 [Burkholderia pseudomallei 1106a]ARK45118.1 hypothetical protein BOC35_01075 [Burkholderia pseudomallei]EBA50003.1 hypothetical protein BURPS305_5809 [Burkholderia pseudomallei 305]EDO89571.1 hypothetical protein BURPSPAST_AC0595 [Burkholderia pseudomallei Pasteur 52237]EEH28044.1 conserved hypothetical protein [Burkholderia pseudomallei Pakistan 9]EES23110.1 hypothetical protein BURPS1106B_2856 [Burkholderia pseudomallei 1106b]PNX01677.1 hypothetical 
MSEAFAARSRRAMRAHCPPRCDLMPHGRAPLRCGIVRAGRAARRVAQAAGGARARAAVTVRCLACRGIAGATRQSGR